MLDRCRLFHHGANQLRSRPFSTLDIRQLFVSSYDYPLVLCIILFGVAINSIVRVTIGSERNVARLLLRW